MIGGISDYYDIIDNLRRTSKKVVIFGAGKLGSEWAFDFLKKSNIEIYAYCDNNYSLWETSINGKKVISPRQLARIANDVVVLVVLRWDAVREVLLQLDKMGISDVIEYSQLINAKGMQELYFPIMEQKIAVYTCVTNDYDIIKKHKWVSDKCDYYVISDKNPEANEMFRYLDISQYLPPGINDFTRQNRYCKINAHKIFPDYRYSIYADGNVVFTKDFLRLINELPKTRIAVASNLYENDIYTHAIRTINNRRDNPEIVKKQMESYWIQGMPKDFGNYWCNVLIREHNHPICKSIMEDWWEQVDSYSRRDQLSLPYVIWKKGFDYEDVLIIDSEFIMTEKPKFWELKANHDKPWRTE